MIDAVRVIGIELRSALRFRRTRALFAGKPLIRALVLGCTLITIPIWQSTFIGERTDLDDSYRVTKSYGGAHHRSHAYFFYTLGLYPVPSRGIQSEFSKESARQMLAENPGAFRIGIAWDRAGILLLAPHMLFGGDVSKPSFLPANAIGLSLALMALFVAFWSARLEVLGFTFVALVGSHPFLLYETYANNNLYAWSMVVGITVLALHIPFVATHRFFLIAEERRWRRNFLWLAPVLTGVLLGTFANVRMTAMPSIVAVIAIYAIHQGLSRAQRVTLIVILASVFLMVFTAWNQYFDRVTERSITYAATDLGQTTSPSWRIIQREPVWHNIWAGLGDYDDKYGYLWGDATAYSFASAKIDKYMNHYDMGTAYLPAYSAVLRENVILNVVNDPLWFASILGKRIWTTMFANVPPRFSIGSESIVIPHQSVVVAIISVFVLLLAVFFKSWSIIGIVLIIISAGATPIVITSEGGYRYVMLALTFMYALLPVLALEGFLAVANRGMTDYAKQDARR